jgi:hypothetical protein
MLENTHHLKSQHTFADFLYWNMVVAVPLLTACIGLASVSVAGLIAYLLLCIAMVAIIYRFFCTHCPHYAQSSGKTRCMFFWGVPGFFKAVPDPYSGFDKAVSIVVPSIIIALPLVWLRLQPGLLVIYGLSLATLIATIRRTECARCVHRQCPVNTIFESDPPETEADSR